MIDLHAHTAESDGTLSPSELVSRALAGGLEALAITDHDTFAGFDQARPVAEASKLDLVCGIELSTKYENRSVHLLGYFPSGKPTARFRSWLAGMQTSRHARNLQLLEKLNACGIAISMEAIGHRNGQMLGRPHIAKFMVDKGYVASIQQAFDEYLAESGSCFVERVETPFPEAVERIRAGGGLSSLAHPCRVSRDASALEATLRAMRETGLDAIEVYHSDHSPNDVALYGSLARDLDLLRTGGSDFHGATKPGIELGTGRNGNVRVPLAVIEELRATAELSGVLSS